MKILFCSGFSPLVRDMDASLRYWRDTLGIPVADENDGYPRTDHLDGLKHFGLWRLSEAAELCFGNPEWPAGPPYAAGQHRVRRRELGRSGRGAAGCWLPAAGGRPSGALGPDRDAAPQPRGHPGRHHDYALDALAARVASPAADVRRIAGERVNHASDRKGLVHSRRVRGQSIVVGVSVHEARVAGKAVGLEADLLWNARKSVRSSVPARVAIGPPGSRRDLRPRPGPTAETPEPAGRRPCPHPSSPGCCPGMPSIDAPNALVSSPRLRMKPSRSTMVLCATSMSFAHRRKMPKLRPTVVSPQATLRTNWLSAHSGPSVPVSRTFSLSHAVLPDKVTPDAAKIENAPPSTRSRTSARDCRRAGCQPPAWAQRCSPA